MALIKTHPSHPPLRRSWKTHHGLKYKGDKEEPWNRQMKVIITWILWDKWGVHGGVLCLTHLLCWRTQCKMGPWALGGRVIDWVRDCSACNWRLWDLGGLGLLEEFLSFLPSLLTSVITVPSFPFLSLSPPWLFLIHFYNRALLYLRRLLPYDAERIGYEQEGEGGKKWHVGFCLQEKDKGRTRGPTHAPVFLSYLFFWWF